MNLPRHFRQAGFAALEISVVVILVAAIAIVGFVVWRQQRDGAQPPTPATEASTNVPAAPAVDNTGDLDAAVQTLDQTNIDAGATEASQLEAQVSDL